jgi:hypothetical protein
MIKPSPVGRMCIVGFEDLSDTMGCYVFVEGHCAPEDVLTCVEHGSNGSNGSNNFSRREYDDLLARAIEHYNRSASVVLNYEAHNPGDSAGYIQLTRSAGRVFIVVDGRPVGRIPAKEFASVEILLVTEEKS